MRTLFILAVTLALTLHTVGALETWKSAKTFLKTKKSKIWTSIKGTRSTKTRRKHEGAEGEGSQTQPQEEEAATSVIPSRMVGFCALAYTCPLGSENRDLGGIVAYAKELAYGEGTSPVEYALDYLYSWDSVQHSQDMSRMNVLLDLSDIIPHKPAKIPKDTCHQQMKNWAAKGLQRVQQEGSKPASEYLEDERLSPQKPIGLIEHVASLEQEAARGYYEGKTAAGFLWGFVHDELNAQRKEGELFLCPAVTANVGSDSVTITLGAKGSRELKIHEIEIIGPRVWKWGDVHGNNVDMLHRIEGSASRVKGPRGVEICEKQLLEYGKVVRKQKKPAEKDVDERERQLQETVKLIYDTLIDDI
ncbi:hypothetical protein FOZ63_029466 [Perkinsus olseni]|uniref:Uncharacterized protein n=1 Tax=Perkinsus olseni TaxID=32597 RepID=A0A7J6SAP7_PEROL|nr:hypothetical protein FOZ62_021032 [Perkinsus olseni]KAF4729853.1 hypothetical protein FOZ63_029466 [Perkinsus olseni]